jgi:hypothetical protein
LDQPVPDRFKPGDYEDVQRALGRIEGKQELILGKLNDLSDDFNDHKNDDQKNFSSIRVMMDRRMGESNTSREAHLKTQDVKLDALKETQDKARGAGWVILGIMSALAASVGGLVMSIISGHLKVH